MIERYSFVAITSVNLQRSREVWVVERVPAAGGRSAWAQIREPDGRLVVLTEGD